ncbi:MAG TPA: malate dehydrogenase (quinone) [Methylophilaceae bacterium]|nr:malate dehydrogenase (quinone) [Methylophilaceae bacterium]
MSEPVKVDVLLVGSGIMSATLGALLSRLDPTLNILMVERLDQVALESSDGWNNAGTGHAGYCELNYTPQDTDGNIAIERALTINAAFEVSLQLWTTLVEQGTLPDPAEFINPTPHQSLVWGESDVAFLRRRYQLLSAHHLFRDMEYSEDRDQLNAWMPLVMAQRATSQKLAATRVAYGADVDFGALARSLVKTLQQQAHFELWTGHAIRQLRQAKDGAWHVGVQNRKTGRSRTIRAGFVFLGAGGGTLPLLQKSGIPEGKGYGGFPVSGQWLVCNNPDIIRQHHAKVYGKAALGAPPMSVPHLDTRIINGKPALLFGPFAGFTTKFLKRGSLLDLATSVKPDNLKPTLAAGLRNLGLTRYLVGEALQSHRARMDALRQFVPTASAEEWTLAKAGKRVQIIKQCGEQGGRLEFGTEIVSAQDGSLAALLGASPGASTSVSAMITVIERCFAEKFKNGDWRDRMKALVPSYGESLVDNAELLNSIRSRNLDILRLR